MSNNEAIAALQAELRGLDQDKTLADIDRERYWAEHQRISKAISKLREEQPSNLYSPEPKPGHFADPFLKLRRELINAYNLARAELRTAGVYDESGCRVKFVEKELHNIYARALGKVDKARSLPVLQRIQADTATEVANAMPFSKAA